MTPNIIYVDNFLASHGHTPTTGATLVRLFKKEGYHVISTSNKRNKALRLADMISTIVRNRKNAVVLIATYSSSAFYFACSCAWVSRLLNIPYIPCLHGGNLPGRIKSSPKLSKAYFKNSFINIAVSGYLNHSMNINGWKSIVIPNNIEIDFYPFKHRTSVILNLFWVRSFHKIYNPLIAIRILDKLLKDYPQARLTMVGPDKDGSLQDCKKLVTELQLEDKVTFTGLLKRDEWTKLSASHDFFINTTNF